MPDKHVHQDKQRIAQQSLSQLQAAKISSQHADWIVTLAFYKALHAVDSHLATLNIHPTKHGGDDGRNESVRQHLRNVFSQYSALYAASQKARYEDYTYQNDPGEVATLINMSIQIENHINTLL